MQMADAEHDLCSVEASRRFIKLSLALQVKEELAPGFVVEDKV